MRNDFREIEPLLMVYYSIYQKYAIVLSEKKDHRLMTVSNFRNHPEYLRKKSM